MNIDHWNSAAGRAEISRSMTPSMLPRRKATPASRSGVGTTGGVGVFLDLFSLACFAFILWCSISKSLGLW